jgi:hypothetical protein
MQSSSEIEEILEVGVTSTQCFPEKVKSKKVRKRNKRQSVSINRDVIKTGYDNSKKN